MKEIKTLSKIFNQLSRRTDLKRNKVLLLPGYSYNQKGYDFYRIQMPLFYLKVSNVDFNSAIVKSRNILENREWDIICQVVTEHTLAVYRKKLINKKREEIMETLAFFGKPNFLYSVRLNLVNYFLPEDESTLIEQMTIALKHLDFYSDVNKLIKNEGNCKNPDKNTPKELIFDTINVSNNINNYGHGMNDKNYNDTEINKIKKENIFDKHEILINILSDLKVNQWLDYLNRNSLILTKKTHLDLQIIIFYLYSSWNEPNTLYESCKHIYDVLENKFDFFELYKKETIGNLKRQKVMFIRFLKLMEIDKKVRKLLGFLYKAYKDITFLKMFISMMVRDYPNMKNRIKKF